MDFILGVARWHSSSLQPLKRIPKALILIHQFLASGTGPPDATGSLWSACLWQFQFFHSRQNRPARYPRRLAHTLDSTAMRMGTKVQVIVLRILSQAGQAVSRWYWFQTGDTRFR